MDMRGLHRPAAGDDAPAIRHRFRATRSAGCRWTWRNSRTNPLYALPIPQPRLVALLVARAQELGVVVRWGHRLRDLEAHRDQVIAAVDGPDGDYAAHRTAAADRRDGRSGRRSGGEWRDRIEIVSGAITLTESNRSVDTASGPDIASTPAAMLLRPGGYVAWAADDASADGLHRALTRWFGAAPVLSHAQ